MLRTPETTSSPWAFEQEVARGLGRAGDLVAAEGDARSRALALVAEDHLLDVDRGAPVVRDRVQPPVLDRPLAVPGLEHRADRGIELFARIVGELLARLVAVDLAEALGQAAQLIGAELGVELDAVLALCLRDRLLVALAGDAAHDVAEHLHQPAVGVAGEALVAGALGEALDRFVAEAEVEDRVEHAGHRDASARAHRDQQRVLRVAEPLAGAGLERRQGRIHLSVEPGRHLPRLHELDAGLGRDREPRRARARARARASSRPGWRPCRRAGRASRASPRRTRRRTASPSAIIGG